MTDVLPMRRIRIHGFNGVNALNGYPQIEIHSPLEMNDGNENEDL